MHRISRVPAPICHSQPRALVGSRFRRLGKVAGDRAGSDILKQQRGGEGQLRMSRLHRGKARWGQGGARSRCCLHLPAQAKSRLLERQREAHTRLTAQQSPGGLRLLPEPRPRLCRRSGRMQAHEKHTPRFFGSVGSASMGSHPSRPQSGPGGRIWKLQAGIYEPCSH